MEKEMMEILFIEVLKNVPEKIEKMLVPGEIVLNAFKSVRDLGAITNKRIIYCDKQGLIGNKVEAFSIPLKSIEMFSHENSGIFDLTSEFQLWTKPKLIKLSFPKGFNTHGFVNAVAEHIL